MHKFYGMRTSHAIVDQFSHELANTHSVQRITNNRLVLIEIENSLGKNRFLYGPLQYGLYEHDSIAFILIGIGGLHFDIVLNAFDLVSGSGEEVEQYLGEVSFLVIHPLTKNVLERSFQFCASFTNELKAVLQKQRDVYRSQFAAREKIDELIGFLDNSTMFRKSKLYAVV